MGIRGNEQGKRLMAEYGSPLGKIILAADERALLGLWFEGQKYFFGALKKEKMAQGENHCLKQAKEWLDRYFAGKKPSLSAVAETDMDTEAGTTEAAMGMDTEAGTTEAAMGMDTEAGTTGAVAVLDSGLLLAPIGTEFQRQVWRLLCGIPSGQVVTYGTLAKRMALLLGRDSMSAQAVGGAVGRNPISVIIPCHRVVGSSGSLTGYAGGIEKKRLLLDMEGYGA